MWELIYWVAILAIVTGLGVMGAVIFRAYQNGLSPAEVLFKPRPEPRIGIVEQASVDGKRRLVLIRRDNVEHLIMTGGPVDVLIEAGIGEDKNSSEAGGVTAATVFARPPRTIGPAGPTTAEDVEAALKR